MEYFAVIDNETNWSNQVMSIGVVIAEADTFKAVEEMYFILDPEYRVGGMFSDVLDLAGKYGRKNLATRVDAIAQMKATFSKYGVKKLFAYNAPFDKGHLIELSKYSWYDIMKVAAYKQYNDKIPPFTECAKSGRMKRGYGVEQMMHILSGDRRYQEVHNAICDARDELELMRLLGKRLDVYEVGLCK